MRLRLALLLLCLDELVLRGLRVGHRLHVLGARGRLRERGILLLDVRPRLRCLRRRIRSLRLGDGDLCTGGGRLRLESSL